MAVVTKDEDFADRVNLAVASPTVVWVRLGNTRRERLLDWFAPQIERIAAMVDGDEKLIELR